MKSGASIFALLTAVVTGIIIADIIANPNGTQAAGNAIATVSGYGISGLLGTAPGNPQKKN